MTNSKLSGRKKAGFALLGIAALHWIATPIVPFFDIPNKAAVVTAVIVSGEIFFAGSIALLGKEYWGRIKSGLRQFFSFGGRRKGDSAKDENTN